MNPKGRTESDVRARICAEVGCGELIPQTETRCEKHRREKPAPFSGATRSNEGLYNTTKWRKLRKRILKNHPNCANCGEHPNSPTLEVHHVRPPRGDEELFFDESNVIPVCPACHKRLTAMEIQNRRTEIWNSKRWNWESHR
jgi:5-methylcytosine-specific restriction enzyme A